MNIDWKIHIRNYYVSKCFDILNVSIKCEKSLEMIYELRVKCNMFFVSGQHESCHSEVDYINSNEPENFREIKTP